MRSDHGWSDVVVRNVSRRGLLLAADIPATPGAYIEIRRAPFTIVARIVWAADQLMGVRLQDPIDIDGFVAVAARELPRSIGKVGHSGGGSRPILVERRSADRLADSRRDSSRFQFVTLGIVLACAALLIAQQVGERLSAPLDRVGSALAARP